MIQPCCEGRGEAKGPPFSFLFFTLLFLQHKETAFFLEYDKLPQQLKIPIIHLANLHWTAVSVGLKISLDYIAQWFPNGGLRAKLIMQAWAPPLRKKKNQQNTTHYLSLLVACYFIISLVLFHKKLQFVLFTVCQMCFNGV